jgi:epoxyqueuosine reductase QueG
MTREYLLKAAADFTETSPTNYLQPEALEEATRLVLPDSFDLNLRFFLPPILSVGAAFDEGFKVIKRPEVVGPHHMLPTDWMPEAKTVISLFLPFCERVIKSNTMDRNEPSWEWLFGRIDAQAHLLAVGELIRDKLIENGYKAHLPYTDKRHVIRVGAFQDIPIPVFSSNWSERHVAYVTGLGTFGRMTNFITKKGTCGRLISVVTDWDTPPDVKDYTGLYDYCAECYACYRACPGEAFDENGKNINKCSGYIRDTCLKYTPRYGCGKCQSGLPCATKRLKNPNSLQ